MTESHDLRLAADKLVAIANIIERPPLDDVRLTQSVALDTAAAIRTVVAALASAPAGDGVEDWGEPLLPLSADRIDAPRRIATELRRIASVFAEGFKMPDFLRDAADEIDRTADERDAALARRRAAVGEREAVIRDRIINTPETADFMDGVPIEAAHQRARWAADHDAGKSPFDWFWLIGYLSQKAAAAAVAGDADKAKHHTISTAAALANWHAHLTGASTSMRPGISPLAKVAGA